jgi:tyrosinase
MHNGRITRRDAVGFLTSGAAVLGGAMAAELPSQVGGIIYRPPLKPRVRENFNTFATNPTKLAALKNGITVMQNRSAMNQDDPTGWYYWASSHGTDNPVPKALLGIYNQCRHGSPHFYSWHRAFLYYFEETLRAASGDSSLNLPYWNWYATPTIPSAFTTPANSTNPLWHSRFSDTTAGLSQGPFSDGNLLGPPWPGFSSDIEGNPHASVHGEIGDDMGAIDRSARDPIFWLHHCNIDRLWNVWVNEGHANPAPGDPWSSESFAFNVSGTMTKKAGQVTDTRTMLGYIYDEETSPVPTPIYWKIIIAAALVAKPWIGPGPVEGNTPAPPVGPGPMERVAPGGMMNMAARVSTASVLGNPFALGPQSGQIRFQLSAPDREHLQRFAGRPRANEQEDVELVLQGVEIAPEGSRGGYSYLVCVAVPQGTTSQEVLDRQCVGVINSFTISVEQEHQRKMGGNSSGGVTLRFPLGRAVKALGPKSFNEEVPVTFVAQHATLRAGQGRANFVSVKDARLDFTGTAKQ